MLCIVRPGICHIVQDIMRVQAVPASAQQASQAVMQQYLMENTRKAEHQSSDVGPAPLCYLHEPLRPEGPLCVNVHRFAFPSSHVNGQLHQQKKSTGFWAVCDAKAFAFMAAHVQPKTRHSRPPGMSRRVCGTAVSCRIGILLHHSADGPQA